MKVNVRMQDWEKEVGGTDQTVRNDRGGPRSSFSAHARQLKECMEPFDGSNGVAVDEPSSGREDTNHRLAVVTERRLSLRKVYTL